MKPMQPNATDPALPELITVPELASLLRISPKTVYGMIERRAIPCVRVLNRVRFRRDDVLALLHENRVPALEG